MNDKYLPKGFANQLAHVVEECGEVLAAAGKTIRFGVFGVNPELPQSLQETNIDWLSRELEDLEAAIKSLRETMKHRENYL